MSVAKMAFPCYSQPYRHHLQLLVLQQLSWQLQPLTPTTPTRASKAILMILCPPLRHYHLSELLLMLPVELYQCSPELLMK